jgi:hypothetical protein
LTLLVALVLLVLAGWYLMQPPSAEKLYQRIEAATNEGDPEAMRSSKGDIATFLEHYSDDPRAPRVRELAEEVDDDAKQANPVQRAYTEAKRYQVINPELAAAKFQALIDVYDDGDQGSEAARHYVKQARLRLAQLNRQIARQVADGRKLLDARLTRAAELAEENPVVSRRIYKGIVALYSDKPWAADQVAQAQAALSAHDAKADADVQAASALESHK